MWETERVRTCDKVFYEDQAAARLAMCSLNEKGRQEGQLIPLPVRVYPCDVCDGWHPTSKPVQGKSPPWDHDPDWVRPAGTAHLQQRFAEVVTGSRRQRKRARRGSSRAAT